MKKVLIILVLLGILVAVSIAPAPVKAQSYMTLRLPGVEVANPMSSKIECRCPHRVNRCINEVVVTL